MAKSKVKNALQKLNDQAYEKLSFHRKVIQHEKNLAQEDKKRRRNG